MRFICPLVFALGFLLVSPLRADDGFLIRRLRLVPNPLPRDIPGEEVLEVKFGITSAGWIPGFGWVLRAYGPDRELLTRETVAHFLVGQTPRRRLAPGRIKGPTEFTAYFPIPEEKAAFLLVMGVPGRLDFRMLPSTGKVEDFRVPLADLNRDLAESSYVLSPPED